MSTGKVTRISVGRLINLGNYEHVRYEIEAQVNDGQSAAETLMGIENVLKRLSPKCPVDDYQLSSLKRMLEGWEEKDWQNRCGDEWEKERQERTDEYKELTAKLEAWKAKQEQDRKLLDDLGAAVQHKDAKDDWDNDEC